MPTRPAISSTHQFQEYQELEFVEAAKCLRTGGLRSMAFGVFR